MKQNIFILCLCFGLGFFCIACKSDSLSKKADELIEVKRLNDRLLVVCLGYDAVTAIATKKGIVVFDAGISPTLTSKYRTIIEKEFKRNDFTYLINTHSHSDHSGGNQAFKDAVIIGHENSLSELDKTNKNPEKTKSWLLKIIQDYDKELQTLQPGTKERKEASCQKTRYQYAYNDAVNNIPVTKPEFTFKDSLSIDLGNATLNLFYFGRAHSESDILIHIPELKLLMTGDLFFPGGKPSLDKYDKKDTDQWIKAMQWIKVCNNDIDLVIGGHGQVMSEKDLEEFSKNIEKMCKN